MTFRFKARAEVRALVGGLVLGSVVGAALGGAYWAGDRARAATDARPIDAPIAMARLSGAQAQGLAMPAGAAIVQPARAPLKQPARAPLKVSTAARPFHMADVAAAPGRDVDCLAEAVYYEARGESAEGQAAIAQVVLNRVRHPAFPKSVCGVVYQGAATGGCQFSFACNGALDARREPGAWTRARAVAERALAGFVMPLVGNATHFHVVSARPDWSGLTRVAQIGMHVFYRFGGGAGAPQRFNAVVEPSPAGSDRAARMVMASLSPRMGGGDDARPDAQYLLASAVTEPSSTPAPAPPTPGPSQTPAGPKTPPVTPTPPSS